MIFLTWIKTQTLSASHAAHTVKEEAQKELSSFFTLFDMNSLGSLLNIALRFIIMLVFILLLRFVVRFFVRRFFRGQKKRAERQQAESKQLATAEQLCFSVINYATVALLLVALMTAIGFDMKGLLASAGVMALAVTFLSQSIIKDWIAGLFILAENQYAVGDWVVIDGVMGKVETLGMRSTVLLTDYGEMVYIPNGQINVVKNLSQRPQRVYLSISTSYDNKPEDVQKALNTACNKVNEAFAKDLAEDSYVMGVGELNVSSVDYQLTFSAYNFRHYAITRALRAEVRQAFLAADLEIPYP